MIQVWHEQANSSPLRKKTTNPELGVGGLHFRLARLTMQSGIYTCVTDRRPSHSIIRNSRINDKTSPSREVFVKHGLPHFHGSPILATLTMQLTPLWYSVPCTRRTAHRASPQCQKRFQVLAPFFLRDRDTLKDIALLDRLLSCTLRTAKLSSKAMYL
jgi:hypothetical protein